MCIAAFPTPVVACSEQISAVPLPVPCTGIDAGVLRTRSRQ